METGVKTLDLNSKVEGDAAPAGPSVEDLIALGAESANAQENAAETAAEVEGEKPRRRRRTKAEIAAARGQTPEQQAAGKELEAFFGPDGIGAVFTTGLNSFYTFCEAAKLSEDEDKMLRRVFAQWCKHRLPSGASAYQPDLLLVACLMMSTLPRLQPIAVKTAPWWKKLWSKVTGKKPPSE